ncbi:MAG: 4Fe-4S dicluster domain-containing protein [Clostridiales bacterium]|nr:4Fe-4S dicluster domain-containing protein [Clostridiales bacterium]
MVKENNTLDHSFKEIVAGRPGGENIKLCYSCGTCTAGCPVSSINKDFSPRAYIRKVLLGMKGEVLSDKNLWQCIQCHRCVAHCPQEVKFADIMRVLRELSVEEGFFSKDTLAGLDRLDDEMLRLRAKLAESILSGGIDSGLSGGSNTIGEAADKGGGA